MTEMVRMTPDDFDALGQQMRMANTGRLKAVLDALEPYVDGSLGPVSPAHVAVYLKTVDQLGKLWRAYDPPRAAVEDSKGADEEQLVLSARQAQVLQELEKLREVGMRRQRG